MRKAPGPIALLLLLVARPALAQLVGAEFQVNVFTVNRQANPQAAIRTSGDFVVAWDSLTQDGSSAGAFARTFDATATPTSADLQLNQFTLNNQGDTSVALDVTGNFVAAWWSDGQDGFGYGAFARRFDSSGSALGSEFQVNTYTTNRQYRTRVAGDAGGDFLVTWISGGQDGDNYGVFAQRYDPNGNPVGGEFQVNTFTTLRQIDPSVAMDDAGGFVIAWTGGAGQDGSDYGAFARRYDSSGTSLGPEFAANTYTTWRQTLAAVGMNPRGDFVVVWSSDGQDGSGYGVFGQRYDSSAMPLGQEFQVNTHTTSDQQRPAVALDAGGNFVVVWQSYGQDGSAEGIFGRLFDTTGAPVGGEFQVNAHTTAAQTRPAVATSPNGHVIITWASDTQDGSLEGVFARRYETDPIFRDGFQ